MFGPASEPSARLRVVLVCLLLALAASATLSSTARASGTAPVCYDATLGPASPGQPYTINLSCYDREQDPIAISIVDQPSVGSLSELAPWFNSASTDFTPPADFTGRATFSYKANDGTSDSAPATITVRAFDGGLSCQSPTPVSVRPGKVAYPELAGLCEAKPAEPLPGQNWSPSVTYTVKRQPAHGTLTLDEFGGAVYTADASYQGADSFAVVGKNFDGMTSPELVQDITVSPNANVAPVCSPPYDFALRTTETKPLSPFCSDPDGDPLTFHATATNGSFSDPVYFDSSHMAALATYTPPADAGTDTVSVTAGDALGATSDPATANVTVHSADYNTAPSCFLSEGGTSVETGGHGEIFAGCYDAEGDLIDLTADTAATKGTVTVGPRPGSPAGVWTLHYTAPADYTGPDSFDLVAGDEAPAPAASQSARTAVSLSVDAVQAPTCVTPAARDDVQSGRDTLIALECWQPHNNFAFEITKQPAHGTVMAPQVPKTLATYHANAGYTGADSFSYRATNTAGASVEVTQDITVVERQNVAPVCSGYDGGNTGAGAPRTVALSCTDADGDPLGISIATGPDHGGTLGALTAQPDGSATVDYTPAADYTGPESLTFQANDGTDNSAPATISFTVVATTPQCTTPPVLELRTDRSTFASLGPCYSPLGQLLTYAVTSGPTHGQLVGDPSFGGALYQPNAGYSGTDSIAFTATDREGRSVSGTLDIRVDPNVNH